MIQKMKSPLYKIREKSVNLEKESMRSLINAP
jgi:hypothetical protein